jgi:hypothetical protein
MVNCTGSSGEQQTTPICMVNREPQSKTALATCGTWQSCSISLVEGELLSFLVLCCLLLNLFANFLKSIFLAALLSCSWPQSFLLVKDLQCLLQQCCCCCHWLPRSSLPIAQSPLSPLVLQFFLACVLFGEQSQLVPMLLSPMLFLSPRLSF